MLLLLAARCSLSATDSTAMTSLDPPVTSLTFAVSETAVVGCLADVDVQLTWIDPRNTTVVNDGR